NGTGAAGHAAAGSTTTASSSETAPAPARGGPAPTGKGSVSGGAKATTAVLAGGGGTAKPSKAAAPAPAALHMLLRVPLAFRVLNRDFSALDPSGFIMGLQLSDIQSEGGTGGARSRRGGAVPMGSPGAAGTAEGSGTEPAVPPWAIALLVLVSVLVLLIVLLFCLMVSGGPAAPCPCVPLSPVPLSLSPWLLRGGAFALTLLALAQTTCSCRRKSRGKLFSAKDSYEPAAEYPPYQSHGRYAAPAGKHSPYSQVAGGAGAGTFTYTNPAAPEQP
uniref:Mucin-1 n=1 Tax=Nothoprocta perdicaria TaxID=30464 RepID=A0A8C6YRQ8_NOTPE